MREGGHLYGIHRVAGGERVLPQAAACLDSSAPLYDNEIEIAVDTLNIDSASFHQISEDVGGDPDAVGARVREIVYQRGKMQNPVTGSGGMLLGSVRAVGPEYPGELEVGDRIATLVSLTLTPLRIEEIREVRMDTDQIDVAATAYLWPTCPVVKIPDDIPPTVALSALDVAGAPAQTMRLVAGARSVLIIGAGKSGMLSAIAAREVMGDYGTIYAFDLHTHSLEHLKEAGFIDVYRSGDATNPIEVLDAMQEMSGGELADVVINTCNVANTEMGAILAARDRGTVYFFNMATSFAKAALGCEGVGKDVDLMIGNGFAHDHANIVLDLIRRYPFWIGSAS